MKKLYDGIEIESLGQEFDVFDMRFVVQDSLVQVGNAPPQRDVIDK